MQDDSVRDSEIIVCKMTVCKRLWYSLQDTYGRVTVCKIWVRMQVIGNRNIVHDLNLYSMWL